MLKRKVETALKKWKQQKSRDVLFLKGPKGVGKTTLIEQFAKENYKSLIYLNFETNPIHKSIFFSSLDMATLTKQITLKLRTSKLIPHETLIFLDEIHLSPRARLAAKTFIEGNRFDCIIASSYAGADIDKFDPTPLEHETLVELSSLDFEEFLWANGVSEKAISDVYEHFTAKKAIPPALHDELIELFKEYLVIGGMPEVVNAFINNHDFREAGKIQNRILRTYEKGIAYHLKKTDRNKVKMCFDSLPAQLVKENKKFQYGVVENKGNARKFESSILWLHDADMVNISFQLEDLKMPFVANARYDIFKIYFKDVGLLTGQLGPIAQQEIIAGRLNVYNYAILESAIAELLAKRGRRLFYYTKSTALSMEFVIDYNNKVTAFSANDADNTKAKAMISLFENHNLEFGIELTLDNLSVTGNLHRYPLYCIMFI